MIDEFWNDEPSPQFVTLGYAQIDVARPHEGAPR
jgi:hypothetical protein